MDEALKSLINNYKETNWHSLLREDLGNFNLKEIKPYLDFIKNFMDKCIEGSDALSYNQKDILRDLLARFEAVKERITNHGDINQNQEIVNLVISFRDTILDDHRVMGLTLALESHKKYSNGKILEQPEVEVKKYRAIIKALEKDLERDIKKAQKVQSEYAEQTIREEASRYGNFFKIESENNRSLSCIYRWVLFSLSFVFCLFAYFALEAHQDIAVENFYELIMKGNIIGKFFILSILFLLITIVSREYLALRHQLTLNQHRHNALSSHKEILNSIQETGNQSDKEISNAILLELTKAMFAIQDTGFIKHQKDSFHENKVVEISKPFFNSNKN